MSAPTLPLLDEQTEQELAPPCEGVWHGEPCEASAEWILALRCPCRNECHVLLCARCLPSIVSLIGVIGATCTICYGRAEIVGTVRL